MKTFILGVALMLASQSSLADVIIDKTDPKNPVYSLNQADFLTLLNTDAPNGEVLSAIDQTLKARGLTLIEAEFDSPSGVKKGEIQLQNPSSSKHLNDTLYFRYELTIVYSAPAKSHGVRNINNGMEVVNVTLTGSFQTDADGKFHSPNALGYELKKVSTEYEFIPAKTRHGAMSSGG